MQESITARDDSLSTTIKTLVKDYLNSVGEGGVTNLHEMFLEQVEPPLLKAVIEYCRYNQSKAANLLGISRGICRTKLMKYFDDQYCGHREDSQSA
jgi:Fis family transcriptional regulator